MFRFTPVVKNLLLINVIVFFGAQLLGLHNWIISMFALYYPESDNFGGWQFVTYMFLHANFRHLLGNMIGLWVFGTWLEDVWGSKRFLQYYLITGIGAAALFMGIEYLELRGVKEDVIAYRLSPNPEDLELLLSEHFEASYAYNYEKIWPIIRAYGQSPNNDELEVTANFIVEQFYQEMVNIPMLGASGALFGILLAAGLLFPYREIMLLFFPVPLRARILIFIYGIYQIYRVIEQTPGDNVAYTAHIGGMVVGYIVLHAWGEAQNRYQ